MYFSIRFWKVIENPLNFDLSQIITLLKNNLEIMLKSRKYDLKHGFKSSQTCVYGHVWTMATSEQQTA